MLGDFEKNFNQQKFEDFKSIVHKKIEITNDIPGTDTRFVRNQLTSWNIPESNSEFAQRVKDVTKEDIKRVYNQIADGLKDMKVVAVSKSETANNLFAS